MRRRVWSVLVCASWAVGCADSEPASGPTSSVGGHAGSGGSGQTGASGSASGGSVDAYFSGGRALAITSTASIDCAGLCAVSFHGPFLNASGDVVTGGSIAGPITLLDGTKRDGPGLSSAGFFGLLDATSLAPKAHRVLAASTSIAGVRVAPSGDGVVLLGPLPGPLDVGGGAPLVPEAGHSGAAFLAAYDRTGKLRFGRVLPGLGASVGVVAGNATGGAAFAVYSAGDVDLGCGPLSVTLGASAFFVLDSQGACLEQRALGDFAHVTEIDALAFGIEPDTVAVAGRFHDELVLDERTLLHTGEAAFLADFFDDGHVRWARAIDGPGRGGPLAMVRDAFGSFAVSTIGTGALNFGWGPRSGADKPNEAHGHVARFDLEGVPLWHVVLPPLESVVPALTKDGTVFVGGSFSGEIDFGDGPRRSAGRRDAWLAQLENGGQTRWSVRWGTAYDEGIDALAVAPDAIYVQGSPAPGPGGTTNAAGTVGISRLSRP